MSAFSAGLRNRNPLVLVAALLLMGPMLLFLQSFFTSGAWSHIPLEYWVRDPHDDPGVVSWKVGREKRDPPSEPAVYLVGGSSAREAIVSGRALAADVRRLGGPSIAAANLSSSLQTFAQSLAIADNLPAEDTWLLVGVNPTRFATATEDSFEQAVGRGMLLKSDSLKEYIAGEYGEYWNDPTILPGIFTYLSDLASVYEQGLSEGRLGSEPYRQHRVDARHVLSPATKRRYVRSWFRQRYPQFKQDFARNAGMLDKLVERARQRGMRVVLVELPLNWKIIGDQFDEPMAQYRPEVREIARKHGVPYVDFNADLGIPNEDFYDLQHLAKRGRVAWQERLAEELVRLMREEEAGQASP